MSEILYPSIKLFGKTIHIPVGVIVSVTIGEEFIGDDDKALSNKETSPEQMESNEETPVSTEEENNNNNESNNITNEKKTDQNSSFSEISKADDEQNESTNNPEDKPNKKPDKILPCPRCQSMDTKFCYYNNYNVNQPRHFCKNCQRYWTAGGSMRNVPVGAGRRKSKSLASNPQFRRIEIPDHVRAEAEAIQHLQPLITNGTVLSFGAEAPLCEPIASVMNLADKTVESQKQNREERLNESPNWSEQASSNSNFYGFPPNISNLNGSPWPYPWTQPPFAFPLYPIPAYWSMPWLSQPLSASSGSSCSASNSLSLGKHSREGNLLNNNSHSDKGSIFTPEKCLWAPKTMRVDVPEKMQTFQCGQPWDSRVMKADLISRRGGLFKAFQSKGDQITHSPEVSQVLLANPAALSRSFSFMENS